MAFDHCVGRAAFPSLFAPWYTDLRGFYSNVIVSSIKRARGRIGHKNTDLRNTRRTENCFTSLAIELVSLTQLNDPRCHMQDKPSAFSQDKCSIPYIKQLFKAPN